MGSPAAKKLKTSASGVPTYLDLDLGQLTVEPTLGGRSDPKYAYVNYKGQRLEFQLATGVGDPVRAPFGIDDGSTFGSKPSIKLELSDPAQLALVRGLEEAVISTAIAHKAEWFPGVKPPPTDDEVRDGFASRVAVDDGGKYPPLLRVNCTLADDGKPPLRVGVTRRLPNGNITPVRPGAPTDVAKGATVVPKLRTQGGAWVKKVKKLAPNTFGLVLEVGELLVVHGADAAGLGAFHLGDGVAVEDDGGGAGGAEDADADRHRTTHAALDQFKLDGQ